MYHYDLPHKFLLHIYISERNVFLPLIIINYYFLFTLTLSVVNKKHLKIQVCQIVFIDVIFRQLLTISVNNIFSYLIEYLTYTAIQNVFQFQNEL